PRRSAPVSPRARHASTPRPRGAPPPARLSDIHRNPAALDAVLAAMPPVDRILVLGDTVGYGPDPNAVIDRLRSVRAKAVLGNHDQAMLDPSVLDWFNPHAAAAARWTQTVLTPASRRYL